MGEKGKPTIGESDAGRAMEALKKQMSQPQTPAESPAAAPPDFDFSRSTAKAPPPTRQGMNALAEVQAKKPKKQRLRLPAAEIADIYARHGGQYGEAPSPKPAASIRDDFKWAYDKVTLAYDRAEQGRISISKPASVDAATADFVQDSITAGVAMAKAGLPIAEGGYTIGYDFGTSSTKVVLRQPFNPAAPAFAIAVPEEMRSAGEPHLWHTAIWVGNDGALSLLPAPGFRMVDGFKAALLSQKAHRYCPGGQLTYAEAAVAFLAMHVAYVLGASRAGTGNIQLSLEALHLGIPVASLKEDGGKLFEAVAAAALALLPDADALSVNRVRAALGERQHKPDLPIRIFPELVGLVSGYASGDARPGAHMIIDCGAATLDIATFTMPLRDGQPVPIHVARVDRLGADACDWAMTAGAEQQDCVRACHHEERLVYAETVTKKDRIGFAKADGGYPYPIVRVGGGFASKVHQEFSDHLQAALSKPFIVPELDRRLIRDTAASAARLLLADGLARDPIQIKAWLLPDDQDHLAGQRWDYDSRYTSKDQM